MYFSAVLALLYTNPWPRYSFSIHAWNMDAIPASNKSNPMMTAGICNISGVLKSVGYIPRTAIYPAPGNAITNPPAKNKHLFFNVPSVPRFAMKFIVRCLILCVSSYNYFQFSTLDNDVQCEKYEIICRFSSDTELYSSVRRARCTSKPDPDRGRLQRFRDLWQ